MWMQACGDLNAHILPTTIGEAFADSQKIIMIKTFKKVESSFGTSFVPQFRQGGFKSFMTTKTQGWGSIL